MTKRKNLRKPVTPNIIRMQEMETTEKLPLVVTLPTLKVEYTDGTNWYSLATESYINSVTTLNVNNLSSSATSYVLLTTDQFVITNNATASVALTLPSAPTIGQRYIIVDGAGVSGTHPISITSINNLVHQTGGGATSTTATININYGQISLTYNGTNWYST